MKGWYLMPLDKSKKITFWTFIIFLDFLIAFAFSEIWVRLFIPVDNTCYYHDPVLGDRFCPNQVRYGYVEEDYANTFVSNSYGFHDVERTKTSSDSVIRFHFYGDSITTAEGVGVSSTIPSLVEKELHHKFPEKGVEVLNMAPAEDSTVAQFLTYKHIGKKFDHDVVVCYFMSDFQDNIIETHKRSRSPYMTIGDNGDLVAIPPKPVDSTSVAERVKNSSRLLRLLANKYLASKWFNDFVAFIDRLKNGFHQNENEKKDVSLVQSRLLANKSYPLTLRIFQEFKHEVESRSGIFVIVDGIRFRENISDYYTNDDLKKFCYKNNIIYIPIYEEYHSLRDTDVEGKFFFRDGHPTEKGNEQLSKVITRKMHSNETIRRLLL